MILWADVIAAIQAYIGDDSDDTLVEIKRHGNIVYFDKCASRAWELLRRNKSVAFTTDQATGTLLPGNLNDIYWLGDSDNAQWARRDRRTYRIDTHGHEWYYSARQTSPAASVTDGAATAGSTAVTSAGAGFGAAGTYTGEFVKIGTNRGIYEVKTHTDASNLVLEEAYRGATASGLTIDFRPVGTRRILIDSADAETLTCEYWIRPLPLYNDEDEILLPEPNRAFILAILISMLRQQKYDVDASRMQGELALLENEQLTRDNQSLYNRPLNAVNGQFFFGRNKHR